MTLLSRAMLGMLPSKDVRWSLVHDAGLQPVLPRC